jgi:sugar lactone lactonase YvrE
MRKLAMAMVSLACVMAFTIPAAAGNRFPSEINLPDGFFPEGIAVGRGSTFYVGSLADGTIYKGDLASGEGAVFTEPTGPFPFTTVGLDVDQRNRVWAAGAVAGTGRVYDGDSGELLATYQFGPGQSFINDVIVSNDAAWFTDSGTEECDQGGLCFIGKTRLFKVVLGPGGTLPDPNDPAAVEEIAVDVEDVYFSNLNGIETMPGGAELIVVHNELGSLYRVDPATGQATLMYGPPLHDPLEGADGVTRVGNTLYVVENGASRIAVIDIDMSTGLGALEKTLPVNGAQTPTTAAVFGSAIYTVDARLATPFVGPYKVFRVER